MLGKDHRILDPEKMPLGEKAPIQVTQSLPAQSAQSTSNIPTWSPSRMQLVTHHREA